MKENKKQIIKRDKGITLVALVITIIILLILAGISIASLTSSGLFNNARRAEEEYSKKQEEENSILGEYENLLEEYIPWTPPTYKNINIIETNPSAATPRKATVIEADASEGIVIKDKKNNEWTWVVVPKSIYTDSKYTVANNNTSVTSSTDYTGIYNILNKYSETYRAGRTGQNVTWTDEWYDGCGVSTAAEYTSMYNKMLSSVYTNGGFWISRYEAGIENSEKLEVGRTSHTNITNSSPKAVSQANMIPYSNVTCSEAQTLASAMSTDSTKTSSLLFGIQWDLVCKYLEGKQGLTVADINSDSKAWGNYRNSSLTLRRGRYNTGPESRTNLWTEYKITTANYVDGDRKTSSNVSYNVLLTTGASEDTNKMNIYDLAGNEYEFTLECNIDADNPCSYRGGGWVSEGSINYANNCNSQNTSFSHANVGFRSTLY